MSGGRHREREGRDPRAAASSEGAIILGCGPPLRVKALAARTEGTTQ